MEASANRYEQLRKTIRRWMARSLVEGLCLLNSAFLTVQVAAQEGGVGMSGQVKANWQTSSYYSTNPVTFTHGSIQNVENGRQAEIGFIPLQITGAQVGQPIPLGRMRVVNGRTVAGTESTNVMLYVSLTLNPGLNAGLLPMPFKLTSTPDTEDAVASADVVELPPLVVPDALLNGKVMRWRLSWGAASEGGSVDGQRLLVNENAEAEADLLLTLEPADLSVGNLVFVDSNGNGRADAGEGRAGVTVQLFRDGDSSASSEPLAETITASDGSYRLPVPEPGHYFVHVPAGMFANGGALAGLASLSDRVPYTEMVGGQTMVGGKPDLPFVFYPGPGATSGSTSYMGPMSITGPLIAHGNPSAAESVFSGSLRFRARSTSLHVGKFFLRSGSVTGTNLTGGTINAVEHQPLLPGGNALNVVRNEARPQASLWHQQDAAASEGVPTMTISTDAAFGSVGDPVQLIRYGAMMDPPLEFRPPGWPLGYPPYWSILYIRVGHASLPNIRITGPVHQIVLEGQVDETSKAAAALLAPRSILLLLPSNSAFPRQVYFSGDNTRPLVLGLKSESVRAGDLRWVKPNSPDEVSWRLHLYNENREPRIYPLTGSTSRTIIRGTIRTNVSPQLSIVIPAENFVVQPLTSIEPELARMLPVDPWLDRDFSATATAGDDDRGEDGIDNVAPALNGISTVVLYVGERSEPVDGTTETGFKAAEDNGFDEASDLTIDFGFLPTQAIGNLVFVDLNRSGQFDPGEGRDGVKVQLFRAGDHPASSPPQRETTTKDGGRFLFTGLDAGSYVVRVPPSEFQQGGPLRFHRVLRQAHDGIWVPNPDFSGVLTEPVTVSADDGEAGMHVDVTRDFGFAHPRLAVGNAVYVDHNGNGGYDAGEGVANVSVQLYRPNLSGNGTQVATVDTDANGHYLFDELEPGAYFIWIDRINFEGSAPLAQMVSIPGSTQSDDDQGEDGIDPLSAYLGAAVRSGVFELLPGNAPTGETGLATAGNEFWDSDMDLTRDFGFLYHIPEFESFAEWKSVHRQAIQGKSGPNDDHDGDGIDNLLEYALTNHIGLSQSLMLPVWTRNHLGHYNFVYETGASAQADIRYTVEINGSLDGASPWKTVTQAPSDVSDEYLGYGVVRYGNLSLDPALSGSSFSFARLRVRLDANDDGQSEAEAVTPVHVIQKRALRGENISFQVPLAGDSAYSGTAGVLEGDTLVVGRSSPWLFSYEAEYYVEVQDGPLVGHHFEVVEGSSGAGRLMLEAEHPRNTAALTSAVNGSRIQLRRHYLIRELFPPEQHVGGTTVSTSANVSYHDASSGRWRTLWLFARDGERKWIDSSDAMFEDMGVEPLMPGQSVFLRTRAAPMQFETTGWVRTAPLRINLHAGNNFIAYPWPVDVSLDGLGLTTANGFVADRRSRDADRLLIWKTDAQHASTGYENYYLFQMGAQAYWVSMADATLSSVNALPLIKGGTGFFLQLRTAHPNWMMPPPVIR